ncbi:unnamed protein product [Rotaria sp. Silwood2]|nr:unnamed protein product [Rotaria sp. Silwood2]
MKYSIKKGHLNVEVGKLLIVLQKNHSCSIKSEMVWAIGYQIKNSFVNDSEKFVDEDLVDKINSVIEGTEYNLNIEAIRFLYEQRQIQKFLSHRNYRQINHKKNQALINYNKKTPQIVITKNQQTVKIKYKSNQSEESVGRLKSIDIFKNSNKKTKVSSTRENYPIISDEDGTDKSPFRTTYREVVYLYERVKNGQALKRQDKDEYLPSKFLGSEKKWFCDSCIKVLLTDRMIAYIFYEISKKQILQDNVIDLLMNCVDTLDHLEKRILGKTTEKEKILKEILMKNQSIKNDHSKSNEMKAKLTLRNEPDVFINLACKIYDESITNHERIAETITSEIQKIRLHAISTIYICSSRNKNVLNNERLNQIQRHQTDNDIDFKKIIIKILGTLADCDNIDYKKFFTTCLEHIEKNIIVEDSISYIYQQSIDEARCQELFNENIICRIIDLLENIYLSEQTKIHICTIINNYLEHSSSKTLNENQLQIFAHVLNNLLYNFELKIEALRSIILTAVKNQHLPDFIIQTLIKNIDKGDNKLYSLAVVALDIVSQRQIIPDVDKLSTKLLVDWVIVNEGADITCEKISSDNADCQSISSLVAGIFVNTLKKNVMINDRTLEYLTKALYSIDKQTCILSAKSLYLASETHELGNNVLIELKEHIDNKIYDVAVYSTVAYTRGLVKLYFKEGSIMKIHMESLPKIYAFDDLQLDEETFSDTVNNNILSLLLNLSKHNLFDDHIFVIFNHILSFESSNQVVAIKILYNYSANKHSIPQDTILALENAIDISEISHEVTKVLSNVIKNRQLVNEKFLRHLADNLYLSNDDQLRKESFKLLDIVNDNQDISDEFFYILELERAIHIINSFPLDRNDAMSYLYELTEQNQKITLSGFKILDKIMNSQFVFDEKIFGILLNICKNEQSIPDNLINKLVERFDPRKVNCQLIDIFENLVKNNQNIPTKLLSKLEKVLENTLISDQF